MGIQVLPLALPPDDELVPLPEATGEDSDAPPEPEVELDSGAGVPPRLGVCS